MNPAPAPATTREQLRARLARDLKWTLDRLATPLAPDETSAERIWAISHGTTAGTPTKPGVWLDTTRGLWLAWAPPAGGKERVEVTAGAVTFGQAAAMLGVSRQRAAALAAAGRLARSEDGRVTVAAVVARMRIANP